MSALGQKQTYALQQAMSALLSIATSIALFGAHWAPPLHSVEQLDFSPT
jgi:hypothetical protein